MLGSRATISPGRSRPVCISRYWSIESKDAAPRRMDVSYMEIVPTDQSYGGSQFHRRGP
jgi:hypothetical protein